MNRKRAIQIASSPIMAEVTYEGLPVYIERVNEITGTAFVRPLNMAGEHREVFVSELVEH